MTKAYLASAFGFSESCKLFLYDYCIPTIRKAGLQVVNPWDLTLLDEIREAEKAGTLARLRREIGRRNAAAIDASDILVANLDGPDIDSGVAWEIGYAFAHGKRCYAWRNDFRASGELGGRVNLQVEFGLWGDVEKTLEALLEHIVRDLAG